MEKIAFIVDRLNLSPFSKGFSTMAEFDSQSNTELFQMTNQIIVTIDSEQEPIHKEPLEFQIPRILNFLRVMKYDFGDASSSIDIYEQYQNLLFCYDKDTLHDIMYWCLQRFDALQKRAYLAKYLLPVDIPPEFLNDDLTYELFNNLKEYQLDFKEVHKAVDKLSNVGNKANEYKNEIIQLEQEKIQLQNKINKMKKDVNQDDSYFQEMLKATGQLRKVQEEEALLYQRIREQRSNLQEIDAKFNEVNKRYNHAKAGNISNQNADQLFAKLQKDVKDLYDRKEALEAIVSEREPILEKLQNLDENDRIMTDDDVQVKREQVRHCEEDIHHLKSRLDAALEKNPKLTVFRQASSMAQKKLHEKIEEVEKYSEEKKRLGRLIQEKENAYELQINQLSVGKLGKADRLRYAATMKEKNEIYKNMQQDLSKMRAELVTLQRTEQILKTKFISTGYGNGNSNKDKLESLIESVEKKRIANGLTYKIWNDNNQGSGSTNNQGSGNNNQGVDDISLEGATLEQVHIMVDKIIKEFKSRQLQLQPVMNELRLIRQDYSEIEAEYMDKKSIFEKLTIGLEMEKLALEKECDDYQEECLREESRFYYMNHLIMINKIKLEKAEKEKKYLKNDGTNKLMRDFQSFKDLYNHKLSQQEQLIKQLRKSQRDLKDSSDAMTNQKSAFQNLQMLLTAKLQSEEQPISGRAMSAGTGNEGTNNSNTRMMMSESKMNNGYGDGDNSWI